MPASRAADRRRADHGARRHHPGADPGADRPAAGARHGMARAVHHPQSRRGRRDRRPRRGDVCRARWWRARPSAAHLRDARAIPIRAALLDCLPPEREALAGRPASREVDPRHVVSPRPAAGCRFAPRCEHRVEAAPRGGADATAKADGRACACAASAGRRCRVTAPLLERQ